MIPIDLPIWTLLRLFILIAAIFAEYDILLPFANIVWLGEGR